LLGTAAAYWLWFTLLQRVPLSRANVFNFLTPFLGFALGVVFFGERAGPAAVAGLSLAALGIVLVERRANSRATFSRRPEQADPGIVQRAP
jgi:drug/metabolite transporter (DMT)-like permease